MMVMLKPQSNSFPERQKELTTQRNASERKITALKHEININLAFNVQNALK